MSLTANKRIVEQFDELLDTGELERLDVLCTPDLVNHTLRPGSQPGLAGTREFLESKLARTQPSDHAWQQLHFIAEGAFVAQFGIRSGRWHGGVFMGVPAAPGTYTRDFATLTGSGTGVSPSAGPSATTSACCDSWEPCTETPQQERRDRLARNRRPSSQPPRSPIRRER